MRRCSFSKENQSIQILRIAYPCEKRGVMSPNPQTPSQIKSRKRVTDHGEVFTPDWLVNDMLNLVAHEAERIDSRFLEPACGEGAFLAPILLRKLASVRRQYGSSPADYEFRAVLALMSIYGVELLADNVRACRERLLILWLAEYEQRLKCPPSAECQKTVRFVLERNILNGNALSMNQVDDAAQDTQDPIIFSEWSAVGGALIKRRDFRQDELLRDQSARTSLEQAKGELPLEYVPKYPVREFPPMDYRKLPEAES